MRRHGRRLLAAAVVAIVACGGATPGVVRAPGRQQNLITSDEIARSGASNALELVRALRSNWLQGRGSTSLLNEGSIVVYVDRARLGGPEAMRGIPASDIAAVRFLGANEANFRYGTGHQHGAIEITTRSAQPSSNGP